MNKAIKLLIMAAAAAGVSAGAFAQQVIRPAPTYVQSGGTAYYPPAPVAAQPVYYAPQPAQPVYYVPPQNAQPVYYAPQPAPQLTLAPAPAYVEEEEIDEEGQGACGQEGRCQESRGQEGCVIGRSSHG